MKVDDKKIAATKAMFTWYRIEFDPEWKTKFGTVFTWECFQSNSYSNEAQLSREPAKGQKKTNEKTRLHMCWPGREPVSFRNELRSPFIWFRERNSHWNESFDPEREPGANSIQNDFTFDPESYKHCTLKCRVRRGIMKKPEQAHSGSKLDPGII